MYRAVAIVALLALVACAERGQPFEFPVGSELEAAELCLQHGYEWFRVRNGVLHCYHAGRDDMFNARAVIAESRLGEIQP